MPNGGERSHTRTPRRSLSPVGTFPGVPMKTPRDSNAEYTHRVFKWSVRELEDQGYSLNVHMKCQVGRLVRFDWIYYSYDPLGVDHWPKPNHGTGPCHVCRS